MLKRAVWRTVSASSAASTAALRRVNLPVVALKFGRDRTNGWQISALLPAAALALTAINQLSKEPAECIGPNFIAEAAELAMPSVCNILVDVRGPFGASGLAAGSGFVIDSSGLIATNAHVVAPAAQVGGRLLVTLWDGRKFPAKVKPNKTVSEGSKN